MKRMTLSPRKKKQLRQSIKYPRISGFSNQGNIQIKGVAFRFVIHFKRSEVLLTHKGIDIQLLFRNT